MRIMNEQIMAGGMNEWMDRWQRGKLMGWMG